MPDVDRARVAGVLAAGATTAAIAADRRRTIYRMTRELTYTEVATALGVSRRAINKAVSDHIAAVRSAAVDAAVDAPSSNER